MADHGHIHGESSRMHGNPSALESSSDEPLLSSGDPALDPVMIELKNLLNPLEIDYTDREGCLPGTREKIIQDAMSWTTDPDRDKDILWIRGDAGSGKSTLAISIVRELRRRNRLGAFLHFDRNDEAKSDPSSIIRTIAYQIGLFHPRYRSALSAALQNNPETPQSTVQMNFDSLLREPLITEGPVDHSTPTVLVFDALDEFKPNISSERDALLHELFSRPGLPVLLIVLSRPTEILTSTFKTDTAACYDIDMNSSENFADLTVYFKTRMQHIHPQGQETWPGYDNIQKLTEMSCGSFTWASAASDLIRSSVDRFENPTEWDFGEINKAMDPFYLRVLRSAGTSKNMTFDAIYRVVMSLILGARRPLRRHTIEVLTMARKRRDPSVAQSAFAEIMQLKSLFNEYPEVHILHPSLSSFLFDLSRCPDTWYLEQYGTNQRLAVCCLEYLRSSIKSVSSLEQQPLLQDDALAYSCEYWVDHFCTSGALSAALRPLVQELLQDRFLQWLEVMSLLQKSNACIQMLQNLNAWVSQQETLDQHGLFATLVSRLLNFAKIQATFVENHPDQIHELETTFRNIITLAQSQAVPDIPPKRVPFSVRGPSEAAETVTSAGAIQRHLTPEQPPKVKSFKDLTEVEQVVHQNEGIPEIAPEPVSLSIELVEVDEIVGSTGGHDIPSHAPPEIPPEPLSIVVDLTDSGDVLESWNDIPEVPPNPVSFSIDLVEAPIGSQSLIPEILPSPPSFAIALDELRDPYQRSVPEHPSSPSSISIALSSDPI